VSALAVFAVAVAIVVAGAIVQLVPPHAVRSALGGFGHEGHLLPFIGVGLLVAARGARNVKK
jgi:hypothetical protein